MAQDSYRTEVHQRSGVPDDEHDLAKQVATDVEVFENSLSSDFRERNMRFYRQYRGFSRFKQDWIQASSENDRDEVLRSTKQEWGAQLHIPMSFRTIETMVPRAIAHRPHLLYLPRQEKFAENVQNIRLLIDAQQDQIDIDLAFQAVMRSGSIYGLGVGKSFWKKEYVARRQMKQRKFLTGQFFVGAKEQACEFDDPFFEDVDIFDFFWDPYGSCPRTCRWMAHRTWLDSAQVLQRIATGVWGTESAALLDAEELRRLGGGSGDKYADVWRDRLDVSGYNVANLTVRGEQPHEVIEWHDGERVLTLLDREVMVQAAESPCVGLSPFGTYRPTPLQKQMVGIGDLEPLEHIQRELDTLRSQRRDMVTMALAAGYAYDVGSIDEDALEFGPNVAIPVTNANVREAIMPLQVQEVSGAGYQEEASILRDFDAISGFSDSLAPGEGGGSTGTATEASLMQAALSRRIQLRSRRFEIEIVRNVATRWLRMNQRMIQDNRDPVRAPAEGYDEQAAEKEGRWRWFPIGPAQLMGEFTIVPEGGSMAARNIPQDRADSQMWQGLANHPQMDPRMALMKSIELLGIRNPEQFLKTQEQPIPPVVLEILQRLGVRPDVIQQALTQGVQERPILQQPGGPSQQEVAQQMAGGPQQ